MKVALFSDTFPPEINGVATATFNLQKTLIEHGHSCIVITTNSFSKEVTYSNGVIRIPGLELKKIYGYRVAGPYNAVAMKIIADFNPDICHVQTDAGIGLFGGIVSNMLSKSLIYTFHTMVEDYAYYVTRGHFDRIARHAIRWYFKGISSRYSEFICPTVKIRNYLRSIGLDLPVAVVPTGIELNRFENEDLDKTRQLKRRFGVADDEFVFLFLGRIAHEKSVDVLIDGYSKFLKQGEPRPTKFIIVGKGPGLEELQSQVNRLGLNDKVIFAGPCDPSVVNEYYHIGDCFVSASTSETQGLTYMEAMASSLVVLARFDDTLVGTINDGENGFFFDNYNLVEKLNHIATMSSSEIKAVTYAASKTVAMYSMENFYKGIIEVYERCIKKNW